jgi:hypothetical protein
MLEYFEGGTGTVSGLGPGNTAGKLLQKKVPLDAPIQSTRHWYRGNIGTGVGIRCHSAACKYQDAIIYCSSNRLFQLAQITVGCFVFSACVHRSMSLTKNYVRWNSSCSMCSKEERLR